MLASTPTSEYDLSTFAVSSPPIDIVTEPAGFLQWDQITPLSGISEMLHDERERERERYNTLYHSNFEPNFAVAPVINCGQCNCLPLNILSLWYFLRRNRRLGSTKAQERVLVKMILFFSSIHLSPPCWQSMCMLQFIPWSRSSLCARASQVSPEARWTKGTENIVFILGQGWD